MRFGNVRGAEYFGLLLVVSALVFLRHPATNFVFDEQEALLANPFLNGDSPPWRAFSLDFWGLPPERTIGSYRPLVSLVWRPLAPTLRLSTPYYFHLVNLLVHALVAREVALFSEERGAGRSSAPLAGLTFSTLVPNVEAVSGVVGLADLLVTFFALRVARRLRGALGLGGFLTVAFGTFAGFLSKETMVGAVAVLGAAALAGTRGRERWLFLGALGFGFVGSVALRNLCFPATPLLLGGEEGAEGPRSLASLLRFFSPPALPVDPLNNPLVGASPFERVATALEVFAKSVRLFLWPFSPSGDYSFPETSAGGPTLGTFVGGGLLLTLLALGGSSLASLVRSSRLGDGALRRDERSFLPRFGALWFVLTALPTANLVVLLPTVRADRLWYLPGVGFAWMLAAGVERWFGGSRVRRRIVVVLVAVFLGLHLVAARSHANDYRDDLAFWRATSETSPRSAKAHLNLGVMLGARGDKEGRLRATRRAVELAPRWPMGRVYLGDILCRMGRVDEAWPHYEAGLGLGPNQKSLVALTLQCLWDQGTYRKYESRLAELAEVHPGSWVAYLVAEIRVRGAEEGGVPREHRPRGYNESGVSSRKSQ